MKEFNRSSIFSGALFVLALIALLPGRLALAEEWNEVSQRDARISLDAPALSQASEYHARKKVRYGIDEIGSWEARSGRFPRAEVYARILQHKARFTSRFDLKNVTEDWNLFEGKNLKFGGQRSYWNSLGQGNYRTFAFQDHECVAFLQFWGMTAETRGVDAGTRMLIGYYCGPSGVSLSELTIENLLDSLRVRSSGELTAETNTSQISDIDAPAPDTEQQARRDPSYYNGRWKARSVDWIAELTLDDGNFRLRAECGQHINSEASGKMDDKGRINAILAPGKWYKVRVSGTINRLQFITRYGNCSKTTLKFERDN